MKPSVNWSHKIGMEFCWQDSDEVLEEKGHWGWEDGAPPTYWRTTTHRHRGRDEGEQAKPHSDQLNKTTSGEEEAETICLQIKMVTTKVNILLWNQLFNNYHIYFQKQYPWNLLYTLTAFSISVGKSQCWLKPSIPVYEFTQIPSQESFFSFWPKKGKKQEFLRDAHYKITWWSISYNSYTLLGLQ